MMLAEWSRFDPVREFATVRSAMDRLLEGGVFPRELSGAVRPVPLDVYETPDHVVVKAYIPGARAEDVDITVEQGVITLKGTVHRETEPEHNPAWTWHVRELAYGSFARSIALPTLADPDKAEAVFENGVLTLRVPKSDEAKPRQIKIQSPMLGTVKQ